MPAARSENGRWERNPGATGSGVSLNLCRRDGHRHGRAWDGDGRDVVYCRRSRPCQRAATTCRASSVTADAPCHAARGGRGGDLIGRACGNLRASGDDHYKRIGVQQRFVATDGRDKAQRIANTRSAASVRSLNTLTAIRSSPRGLLSAHSCRRYWFSIRFLKTGSRFVLSISASPVSTNAGNGEVGSRK